MLFINSYKAQYGKNYRHELFAVRQADHAG